MRVIIETGSFGTEWAIIDDAKVVAVAQTEVINPYLQTRREISKMVRLNLPPIFFKHKYENIFFYGSRCGSDKRKQTVVMALESQFKSHVTVESTLLAAARGLLGDKAGIACVLANHSGSCHYNGKRITNRVLSGGYLLGDEGSGIVLGRMFLADLIKNMTPRTLSVDFYEHFKVTANTLQDLVYDLEEPDLFLVDVTEFLKLRKQHTYVKELVKRNFKDFFERCILQYDYKNLPLCAVGHIAKDFKTELKAVAKEYGVKVVKAIELTPINGVIEYHLKHPMIKE